METHQPANAEQFLTRRGLLSGLGLLGGGLLACGLAGSGAGAQPGAGSSQGASPEPRRARRQRSLGYVVVSPDGPRDGGDFGKLTPGTRTSGIQEALDYAKANRRDVYIAGGAMPAAFTPGVTYNLQETLRIPWMQDFRLDAGECLINYEPSGGDAVVFDSQMSCWYKFGLILSHSDGAVVRLQPRTKGPDNFSVITCTKFEINALVGAGSVFPGAGVRGKGTGLLADSSGGPIFSNDIFAIEVNACDVGVDLSRGTTNNYIRMPFVHLCNTHIRMAGAEGNRIEASVHSEGIEGSVGVIVSGRGNFLTLNILQTADNKNLVFAEDASDNLVIALNLPNGFTNNAARPTNRIITCAPVGFGLPTPPVPASGRPLVNREPFTAEVIILAPGEVSEWTLTDAGGVSQTVAAGFSPGQRFILQPGDQIALAYKAAPAWRWKALA